MGLIMKKRLLVSLYFVISLTFLSFPQENPIKKELSSEDKIYGLSLLWKEASYNFAHFDHIPDLDWNKIYQEFIPKVLSTKSTEEYYKVLKHF